MTNAIVGVLWILVWVLAAFLALASWLRLRARLRAHVARGGVDDEDVRRIVETGRYSSDEDEPLDLGRVREEERRFWEEVEWDDAEEW